MVAVEADPEALQEVPMAAQHFSIRPPGHSCVVLLEVVVVQEPRGETEGGRDEGALPAVRGLPGLVEQVEPETQRGGREGAGRGGLEQCPRDVTAADLRPAAVLDDGP